MTAKYTYLLTNLVNYLLTTRMTSDVLKLAKVPPLVISAIETLIEKWSTNLHLTCHEGDIQSNTIHYLRCIFQGDSLSVLLFILSVNPLSFLLKKLKGYQIGPFGQIGQTWYHHTTIGPFWPDWYQIGLIGQTWYHHKPFIFCSWFKLIAVNLNLLKQ